MDIRRDFYLDKLIKGKAYIEIPKDITYPTWDFATQELTFVSLSRPIPWRTLFTMSFVCVVTVWMWVSFIKILFHHTMMNMVS